MRKCINWHIVYIYNHVGCKINKYLTTERLHSALASRTQKRVWPKQLVAIESQSLWAHLLESLTLLTARSWRLLHRWQRCIARHVAHRREQFSFDARTATRENGCPTVWRLQVVEPNHCVVHKDARSTLWAQPWGQRGLEKTLLMFDNLETPV